MKKWIKQYIDLLYNIDCNKIDIEAAKSLKIKYIPTKLYKYREFNKFSQENFKNDTVWINTSYEYNDPYDCALDLSISLESINRIRKNTIHLFRKNRGLKISPKEERFLNECSNLREFYMNLAKKDLQTTKERYNPEEIVEATMNAINKEHNLLIEKYRDKVQKSILNCSFSEVKDSILMWSHYAKNHSGFCIQYNFKKLGEKSDLTRMLQPVIYKNEIFDITPYMKDMKNLNCLMISYLAMIKSTKWKYEKEWRYSCVWGPSAEPFNKGVNTPTAVYLGAKMEEKDALFIKKIAKEKSIPVYKMKMKSNEFKLIPEKSYKKKIMYTKTVPVLG